MFPKPPQIDGPPLEDKRNHGILSRIKNKISKLFEERDTPNHTRARGDRAEQIAVDHLKANNYRIVERNFQCKVGEIDIIASHQGELAFVEVRSRHSPTARNPVYTVDRVKQKKIIRAAQVYLSKHDKHDTLARFDVVIVTLGTEPQVEVIPNAFPAEGYSFNL
jgi:putative endonuclease